MVQFNIYVIKIPKEEERKNGAEKKCEDIMARNVPKPIKVKDINQQIHTQAILDRINTKKTTLEAHDSETTKIKM